MNISITQCDVCETEVRGSAPDSGQPVYGQFSTLPDGWFHLDATTTLKEAPTEEQVKMVDAMKDVLSDLPSPPKVQRAGAVAMDVALSSFAKLQRPITITLDVCPDCQENKIDLLMLVRKKAMAKAGGPRPDFDLGFEEA